MQQFFPMLTAKVGQIIDYMKINAAFIFIIQIHEQWQRRTSNTFSLNDILISSSPFELLK